jgi:hypothetical protein
VWQPPGVEVDALDVTATITEELAFHVRRRVGRLLRASSDER